MISKKLLGMSQGKATLATLAGLAALASFAAATGALAGCGRVEAAPDRADRPDPEKAAVTEAVQLYFQGHATGDGNFWRKAFHPEAKLFWVKDGALAQKTATEFAAGASGKPAADEGKRVRKILAVDHAGDAAMVKVELTYPDVAFVDYLSLLKIDGRWQIVNKIFHRRAPAAAVPSRK